MTATKQQLIDLESAINIIDMECDGDTTTELLPSLRSLLSSLQEQGEPHIRLEINKLPKEGEVHRFGHCTPCANQGLRNCAHFDTCGSGIVYSIIRGEHSSGWIPCKERLPEN